MTKQSWLWVAAGACAILLALVATAGVFIVAGAGQSVQRHQGWMGAKPPTSIDCQLPPSVGTLVTFTAQDMGAMSGGMMGTNMGTMTFVPRQASAPAGDVLIELRNLGSGAHELLIFPLTGNQQPGARTVGPDDRLSEVGVMGEAHPICPSGTGIDGTPVGGISRVKLKLAAGRNEIVCNLPGHYRHGMSALLIVS